MPNPLTIGSLFSGIGGLELGLERTGGFRTVWQVEIDDYATRILERHWPGIERWRDVRTFIAHANRPWKSQQARCISAFRRWACDRRKKWRCEHYVDLICGGFPCPPVSVAGKRLGVADDRWLWPEFRRIVGILRPKYVLVENVRGLLSADAGRIFGRILRDLADLGYDAQWQVLPAAAFGAPHIRERVFIVAYSDCTRLAEWQGTDSGGAWQDGGAELGGGKWWTAEPDVGRVAHGVRNRVDRLKCLGNAVVPQVAEWIGHGILDRNWSDQMLIKCAYCDREVDGTKLQTCRYCGEIELCRWCINEDRHDCIVYEDDD